jgi:lipoprotein signal peptidase
MTNKSKHAGLGIAMGAALGAVFGVLAGNMGVWLIIGVAIGVFIGLSVPRKQKDCPQCAQVHRTHDNRTHGMRDPRQQASS